MHNLSVKLLKTCKEWHNNVIIKHIQVMHSHISRFTVIQCFATHNYWSYWNIKIRSDLFYFNQRMNNPQIMMMCNCLNPPCMIVLSKDITAYTFIGIENTTVLPNLWWSITDVFFTQDVVKRQYCRNQHAAHSVGKTLRSEVPPP